MKIQNYTSSILLELEVNLPQGVYLFLGYSEKDEKLLRAVTNEGAQEAIGAIQGLVRYHNVNSNKVDLNDILKLID